MTELLAPAGNKEAFQAALCAGADAVYVGGQKYGARAYADNFDEQTLLWAIDTAHLYEKKIYMTINTLVKKPELKELYDYFLPFYQAGLDGIIVQDFGVVSLMQKYFPQMKLHASTQMTVTGSMGAKLLKEKGMERVVPARELSLQEIVEIKKEADIEVETFIHGAMCYGYSGQCLFSSMLGQRSGNRGRCAGPCRLPYKAYYDGKRLNDEQSLYQLSLKDLCSLDIIPDLMDAGIDSFKIEGRMKSKEYVSFVTGLYRYYMDAYHTNPKEYRVEEKDKRNLQNLFSRGSIETGYYFVHNGRHLVTLQKPGYQTFSAENGCRNETVSDAICDLPRIPLTGYFYAHKEEAMSLTVMTLEKNTKAVTVTGETVNQSHSRPASSEDIKKALLKTGNTNYFFDELHLDIQPDVFLPNRQLNELRRRAIDRMTEELLGLYRRNCYMQEPQMTSHQRSAHKPQTKNTAQDFAYTKTGFVVCVQSASQFYALKDSHKINIVFLSWDCFEETAKDFNSFKRRIKSMKEKGILVGLRFCPVTRKRTITLYETYKEVLNRKLFDLFMINNLETLAYVKASFPDVTLISDSRFYIFQEEALSIFKEYGIYDHAISYELHEKEMATLINSGREMGHRFLIPVYGYIPVMESAGCILKTNRICTKDGNGEVYLVDRHNKKLPVIRHCSYCENTIYNTVPLSLHKEISGLLAMGAHNFIMSFTVESEQEMNRIIGWYERLLDGMVCEPIISDFTKGHFAKGVE